MAARRLYRRPRISSRTVRRVGLYVLLVAVAALFVGPFLILLSAATKPASQDVFGFPPDLIPRPPVGDWFREAWTTIPYARFLLNSVVYVGITVPVYLVVSALTAYPLARIASVLVHGLPGALARVTGAFARVTGALARVS